MEDLFCRLVLYLTFVCVHKGILILYCLDECYRVRKTSRYEERAKQEV